MTGMTQAKSAVAVQVDAAAGTTAVTNIAVTGIATSDTLVAVIETASGGALTSRTAEASITSAGNIQLSTTDTSGDYLLIVWIDNSL